MPNRSDEVSPFFAFIRRYNVRMRDDQSLYLLFVALDPEHKDTVNVNIRISDEPELTAKTNAILLSEFRSIFLNYFKTPAERLEHDIQRLRDGEGFTIYLSVSEDSINSSGLLPRRPNF